MRYYLCGLIVFCSLSAALAQSTKPAGSGSILTGMLPMMLVMFAIIYFLMIRPEQKKQKLRQQMLNNLKKGQKVISAGGIHGVVNNIKDSTVMVKVAENVVLEFTKSTLVAVVTETKDNDKGKEDKALESKSEAKSK